MPAGTLLTVRLVDELRPLIYPITLGQGKRHFLAVMGMPIATVSCEQASTGVLARVCAPARGITPPWDIPFLNSGKSANRARFHSHSSGSEMTTESGLFRYGLV